MSHANTENSRAQGLNILSTRLGTLRQVLEDNFTIQPDGSVSNLLDAGGTDRVVHLPPLVQGGGLFFIVGNVGSTGNLSVESANGLPLSTLRPNESAFFVSSEAEWLTHRAWGNLQIFHPAGTTPLEGLVPPVGALDAPGTLFLRNDGQWAQVPDTGLHDAFKFITDGTRTAVGAGPDTFRLRSDGSISVVVTNNDPTYGDNALFSVVDSLVDHNLLLHYVADQHVAHSSVAVTAGAGLAGGGNIASSFSISLDISTLSLGTPALSSEIAFNNGANRAATLTTVNAILDHNALVNFVANKHIDHSLVAVQAGVGLTGGGDITTTRTLNLAINSLAVDGVATADLIPFYDVSGSDHNVLTFGSFNASLDHYSLLNFVPSQHIDHGGIGINAGTGLTGGGNLLTSQTLNVDVGTTAGKIVQLDGSAKLPAVDGSNLTHLPVTNSEYLGTASYAVSGGIGTYTFTGVGTVPTVLLGAEKFRCLIADTSSEALMNFNVVGTTAGSLPLYGVGGKKRATYFDIQKGQDCVFEYTPGISGYILRSSSASWTDAVVPEGRIGVEADAQGSSTGVNVGPRGRGSNVLLKNSSTGGWWMCKVFPGFNQQLFNHSAYLEGVAGQSLAGSEFYYMFLFNSDPTDPNAVAIDFKITPNGQNTLGFYTHPLDETRRLLGFVYTMGSNVALITGAANPQILVHSIMDGELIPIQTSEITFSTASTSPVTGGSTTTVVIDAREQLPFFTIDCDFSNAGAATGFTALNVAGLTANPDGSRSGYSFFLSTRAATVSAGGHAYLGQNYGGALSTGVVQFTPYFWTSAGTGVFEFKGTTLPYQ